MSREVRHGASDHGGARCIILRSGDIAARNTPAAGRCVRAVVTSDGIGGTGGFGGTVPLAVTSDGIGGTGGFGGALPLGDGRGRVVTGPGSGSGAAGSGMVSFPWQAGPAAASSATAWLAADRNAATEDGRASGC
jgi:hypothetical protein